MSLDKLSPEEQAHGGMWAEFLHIPDKKFYDFNQVRQEIINETDRVTGQTKCVSREPINLKIYSPNVVNLSLVDLPGITKVPTEGQPADIEMQIRSMCMEFISNPNAIIIAVSAANQDITTSEGLLMAKQIDPEGLRTIGVLTKVDIMDQGTDCLNVLENRVIPLKKGYICVINRSQKDINNNVPIHEALKKEANFFKNHPSYQSVLNICGTENLTKILSDVLLTHIKQCLPDIRKQVKDLTATFAEELHNLGESLTENFSERQKDSLILRILTDFSAHFNRIIEGREINDNSELHGGSRIYYIFNELFNKRIRNIDPFYNLNENKIRIAIANANGIRPSLFIPEFSFINLIKQQISLLESPGLDCLEKVMEEITNIINDLFIPELNRFPKLKAKIIENSLNLLKECYDPTYKMIVNLINIESSYINTSHPNFIKAKAAITTVSQHRSKINADLQINNQSGMNPNNNPKQNAYMGIFSSQNKSNNNSDSLSTSTSTTSSTSSVNNTRLDNMPDRVTFLNPPDNDERIEIDVIKTLITSYFDIVKTNFCDFVPKTIMFSLILKFKDSLLSELVSTLHRDESVVHLLSEAPGIEEKRNHIKKMLKLLKLSNNIINEVRDYSSTSKYY